MDTWKITRKIRNGGIGFVLLVSFVLVTGAFLEVSGQERFSLNDDGKTVLDATTGYLWQQDDYDRTVTREEAFQYCEGLTLGEYADWRLPTRDELAAIREAADAGSPWIDSIFSAHAEGYWSRTLCQEETDDNESGYVVDFGAAEESCESWQAYRYTRCVRYNQAGSVLLLSVSPTSYTFESMNIVDSFDSPGSDPLGLAYDGTYLWNVDSANNMLYKLETTGGVVESFDTPTYNAKGLVYLGNYLWISTLTNKRIYKLDMSGNALGYITGPGNNITDLGSDGYYLWCADTDQDKIYQINTAGSISFSFDAPAGNPTGLTYDGEYLWIADAATRKIYKTDTAGTILETYASPGNNPTGLAYDGTYLWNADLSDTIYKLSIDTQIFEVVNDGDTKAVIDTLRITGQEAGDFTLQNDMCSGRTLSPSGSCTFAVQISLDQQRDKSAGVEIPYHNEANDQQDTLTIPLSWAQKSTIQFSAGSYTVEENQNEATITVTITRSDSSDSTVSVSYATANGTAVSGEDYTAASGTLTWEANDTESKTFKVYLLEDDEEEETETVKLTLSNPSDNAELGDTASATLNIEDDDEVNCFISITGAGFLK